MCACVCACVCVCSNQNCELVKFNGRLREEVKLARAGAKHARLPKLVCMCLCRGSSQARCRYKCVYVYLHILRLNHVVGGVGVCVCVCVFVRACVYCGWQLSRKLARSRLKITDCANNSEIHLNCSQSESHRQRCVRGGVACAT
jgi:hypothetical protein